MRKILLFLLALFLVLCVYLWDKGKDYHVVQTEIEISASPEKVWAVLVDIGSWHEWSPIINDSSGDASLSSILSITMRGEKEYQDGPKYHPVITRLDAPKVFHWRAVMMNSIVMTNDKVIELEKTSAGTRLVHKELFKGMVVPLLSNKFDENVPHMLSAMNEALKARVEKK